MANSYYENDEYDSAGDTIIQAWGKNYHLQLIGETYSPDLEWDIFILFINIMAELVSFLIVYSNTINTHVHSD